MHHVLWSALALSVRAASSVAQADWTDRTAAVTGTTIAGTPGIPGPRLRSGVATDGSFMIIHGGNVGGTELADFWLYDPVSDSWLELDATTGPGPLRRGAMDWDVDDNVLVLFGGSPDATATNAIDQTWEWDPINGWVNVTPATFPPARIVHGMAWDPVTGHVLLFGGDNGVDLNDTWLYDAGTDTWTQHTSTNPQPAARERSSVVSVPSIPGILLVGGRNGTGVGNYFSDTWIWDGSDWTELIPSTLAGGGPRAADGGLANISLVYDELRDRVVLYGGVGNNGATFRSDQTWEYDRTSGTWAQKVTSNAPSPRNAAAAAYVAAAQTTVVFGGFTGTGGATGALGDTWEYQTSAIASSTQVGTGCASSVGMPILDVSGLPWAGDQVTFTMSNVPPGPAISSLGIGFSNTNWAGLPLPLDLTILNSPGCVIRSSRQSETPAAATPLAITVSTDPALLGMPFYAQGIVVEVPLSFGVTPSFELVIGER